MATLRRQGAGDHAGGGGGGGRVIVLRSRFQGSSAEEVWASLASSLAREEVARLCPGDGITEADTLQDSEDVSDKTVEDMSDDNEDNDGSDDEDRSEEVNNDPEEYFETSQYNFYNKRTDEPEVVVTEPPEEEEDEEVSPRVERVRGDQTTSVRDLARNSAADDPSVKLYNHGEVPYSTRAHLRHY